MDENQRQMMARALLGKGVAGRAADMTNIRALYNKADAEAQMQGMKLPPIEEWIKQQQQPQHLTGLEL